MPITGGGAGGGDTYIDRGDATGWDYTQATLIMDDAWHDLDLSSIVTDIGAKLIVLDVYLNDVAAIKAAFFRKNGNVNVYSKASVQTMVIGTGFEINVNVPCDTNQVIEYRCNPGADYFYIVVLGWWKPA